jgi:hypothetical protein
MNQQVRRKIGVVTLILISVGLGLLIKNVKIGLILGLAFGLLAGGLISGRHHK